VADPANASPSSPSSGGRHHTTQFETVMRGYDRRQVDIIIEEKDKAIARLEAELAETQRRLSASTDNTEQLQDELRHQRTTAAAAAPQEDGFGLRAEKLLRLAEQEAAEVRNQASADSTAIVEQARNEAEKHRHEIEQELITRASAAEQQAARRSAELQDREQHIADQLNSARDQADQLHATAARAADRLREEAVAAAEETTLRAESAAKRLVGQATQEVTRLTTLQDGIRSELQRLAEMLSNEVSSDLGR